MLSTLIKEARDHIIGSQFASFKKYFQKFQSIDFIPIRSKTDEVESAFSDTDTHSESEDIP